MALTIEDFVIDAEAVDRLSDEKRLAEYFEEGKPLQELFGFSNEATAEFYEVAKGLIEERRYEEAVKAFVFLTTLNPYISEFWSGLGLSKQHLDLNDDALFAFSVAFRLDGRSIFPYVLAAQCCIKANDFDRAFEIIGEAETFAKEHADDPDADQFRKDVAAAKEFVVQERMRRR